MGYPHAWPSAKSSMPGRTGADDSRNTNTLKSVSGPGAFEGPYLPERDHGLCHCFKQRFSSHLDVMDAFRIRVAHTALAPWHDSITICAYCSPCFGSILNLSTDESWAKRLVPQRQREKIMKCHLNMPPLGALRPPHVRGPTIPPHILKQLEEHRAQERRAWRLGRNRSAGLDAKGAYSLRYDHSFNARTGSGSHIEIKVCRWYPVLETPVS